MEKEISARDVKPKLVKPKVGDVIGGKFKVIKGLGEGGFGVVYEMAIRSGERYAMKMELESPAEEEPGLELEGAVLRRPQGYKHILRFVDEGWSVE